MVPAQSRDLGREPAAHPRGPGQMTCPNDMGVSYRLFFVAGARNFNEVTVALTNCRVVTGLGAPRS